MWDKKLNELPDCTCSPTKYRNSYWVIGILYCGLNKWHAIARSHILVTSFTINWKSFHIQKAGSKIVRYYVYIFRYITEQNVIKDKIRDICREWWIWDIVRIFRRKELSSLEGQFSTISCTMFLCLNSHLQSRRRLCELSHVVLQAKGLD